MTARLEEGRDKETTKGNVYTSESVRSEQFTIYVTDGAFLLGEDSSTMSRTFYSWGLAHVLDDVCLEKAGSHISPKIISGLSGGWRMEAEKKLFEDFKKGTKEDKQRK